MGYKSRGNFQVNCCLKRCSNRDISCTACWRFSCYEPLDNQDSAEKRMNEENRSVLAVENDTKDNSIESTNR